jgi:hypothetical protein
VRAAVTVSAKAITRATLRAAGFTEYDPLGAAGDPHCVGYFQKTVAGALLNVSFWRFPRVRGTQVNFEVLAIDRELSFDIGMRGVPKRWSVAELELYVAALLARIRRPLTPRAPGAREVARPRSSTVR